MGKFLKKWGIIICIAFIALVIFTIKTYGVVEQITSDMLENPNSEDRKSVV